MSEGASAVNASQSPSAALRSVDVQICPSSLRLKPLQNVAASAFHEALGNLSVPPPDALSAALGPPWLQPRHATTATVRATTEASRRRASRDATGRIPV